MLSVIFSQDLSYAEELASLIADAGPGEKPVTETDLFALLSMPPAERLHAVWLDFSDEQTAKMGLDFARQLSKIRPETNIVILADSGEYAYDAFTVHASGYLLKPVTRDMIAEEIAYYRRPAGTAADAEHSERKFYAQCFGNFELFFDGKPVRFSRALAKEAMAYLIDRRGAGCTVGEICTVLWEDRQADTNLKSQCRVVLASLKKDLAAVGMEDALIKEWNTWSINMSKFDCDYYEYLNNTRTSDHPFRGEYMAQYSWAEITSGTLYEEEM